ncbi:thiamine phosphate synthase [Malaciobacter halophilus]|uniref:Thiamine phosphate synthase n=1 Tax=Malaciobacter halophilus TaxID=197482 RepID=A0A2N1J439_9BACT|nr:thiamine phosphate synthase [Malaciobacter halophilus]AXH08748.1 thiamine phosphate synthase (TMP-TENI domain) [Malaciobacter halophilus]PKI81274.1 thiamine phosphate synthase [Malaciobacter halophilus]
MKHYLITDPKYYSNNTTLLRKNLIRAFKNHKVDIACFRDKESSNIEDLAKTFVEVCKEYNIKTILINTHINLAKELNATGVHLNSEQFDSIKEAKEKDLYTVVSCHSYDDIQKAQNLHANCVTYSPIFEVANKPKAKGINKLKEAVRVFEDIDIIALGGIVDDSHVEKITNAKPYGFASIRYFLN